MVRSIAARGEIGTTRGAARIRLLLLAALALLALALLGSGTARAAFPGENGWLAFQRDGDVWAIAPDGGVRAGESFLTCSAGDHARPARSPASSPAWSPDGRRIAFVRSQSGGSTAVIPWIFVLNPDGSQTRLIMDGSHPAWSPDGERIAFTGFEAIGVINADGSGRTSIPDTEGGREPSWSPDGERIAFVRSAGFLRTGIWVMNPDGSEGAQLSVGGSAPNWSPDGERIAFSRGGDIWAMNADGSSEVRLTDSGPVTDSSPAWSPDGERIALSVGGGGGAWIDVINADGSERRTIGFRGSAPDWQPLAERSDIHRLLPSQLCLGRVRQNTNRGIARLAVEVPRPGRVILQRRPGVRRFAKFHRNWGPGRVVLRVRPRGRARHRLHHQTNRLSVRARVTYRPRIGESVTKGRRVWLVKR